MYYYQLIMANTSRSKQRSSDRLRWLAVEQKWVYKASDSLAGDEGRIWWLADCTLPHIPPPLTARCLTTLFHYLRLSM